MRVPNRRDLVASPASFIAFGAGLGLAPVAPGTFGTLLGIPLLFLMPSALPAYLVVTLLLFLLGVWCCGQASRSLGVHDHGSIVWDEVVGYLVTMAAVPRSWPWVIAGFLVFRLFDVLKPPPIRTVDAKVHGGFGIMLDDLIAALMSLVLMQLLVWLWR
ncbi:MAG: phosphatidylglycerophosphatase A [Gammaproteobacteria bacterium]|nr:MAG: phosphatidylglycerophosphatase A [Gammaproteobacteria bacterium]PIE36617.1 MAG: phosphatidylglycerophosphatase A [Gammaproteobacteria bacterium]